MSKYHTTNHKSQVVYNEITYTCEFHIDHEINGDTEPDWHTPVLDTILDEDDNEITGALYDKIESVWEKEI